MKEERKITNEELVAQYKTQINAGNNESANLIFNRIINKNMGTIYRLIEAVTKERSDITEEDKEDLRQESLIAVMEAVNTYDERLARFNTHVHNRVEYKIRDWFEKQHKVISIPKDKQRYCSIYYDIINDYKQNNNGISPSDEYIRMQMGVEESTYWDIKAALCAYNIESLYKDEEDDSEEKLIDMIPDERDGFFESLFQAYREKLIKCVLQLRDKKERKVIFDYYYNDKSFVEIANELGVSKQRINTIKNNAYQHLGKIKEVRDFAIELGVVRID